jgi:hypothetical protein
MGVEGMFSAGRAGESDRDHEQMFTGEPAFNIAGSPDEVKENSPLPQKRAQS